MISARRLARMVVDAVLPPVCLSCGALVAEPGALCAQCWESVSFLSPPLCRCCGHPFEVDAGPEASCGQCLDHPPPWGRARAVFRYDDSSKPLVLRFKHADRIEGAPAFARWMARSGADILTGAELLVPVPLHRWRLLARRYNQAALLALELAKLTGIRAEPDLLRRIRRTPVMGHLTRKERRRNVRGAFAVHPRMASRLKGRAVVLVDDVLTTGATVGECARILMAAGAKSVDVLTLGRVVLQQ